MVVEGYSTPKRIDSWDISIMAVPTLHCCGQSVAIPQQSLDPLEPLPSSAALYTTVGYGIRGLHWNLTHLDNYKVDMDAEVARKRKRHTIACDWIVYRMGGIGADRCHNG
jgi:hypothetical protein